MQQMVPAKALAAAPVKDAKLDEALARECQATLSYAEHTLVALARTVPRDTIRICKKNSTAFAKKRLNMTPRFILFTLKCNNITANPLKLNSKSINFKNL
jgi:hypothetical protein